MKNLFSIVFLFAGLVSINAQVASNKANNNLVATKKYKSEATVNQKQSPKKHSIKRTVKLIREEKEITTK